MKSFSHLSVNICMLAAGIFTANIATAVSAKYTNSGTFTPPAGITQVTVECWGGGGAGGSAKKTTVTSGGCGGGGGAYAKKLVVPVTPGVEYTVTIPAAAVAPAADSGFVTGDRVNGANVTFTGDGGVTVTANGGQGGECGVDATGAIGGGGAAGTHDVDYAGGNGGRSPGNAGGGGSGASDLGAGNSTATTGAGAQKAGSDVDHNGGAGGSGKTGAGNGNAGTAQPGGGGGGAKASVANTAYRGAAGAKGMIIISYSGGAVVKANNADNLDLINSWMGGSAPDATGIAKWDSTVTSANTTLLGTDATWGGILIANPTGLVTIGTGNVLTNNGGIDMSSATADLTLNCDLALGGSAVWNVAANRTLTVGGIITGAQPITKLGDGKVIMTSSNSYSGATAINGGIMQHGASDVIPDGSGKGDVSLAVDTVLDLNSYSDNVNGLSGAGIVDNTAASTSSTLTVGGNNVSSSFSGVIQNSGAASVLNLIKTGSGTLTLSGVNTFTGTTTLNGGNLSLANANALDNISGLTSNGATLGFGTNNVVVAAPVTLGGNLSVIVQSNGILASLDGVISGTGNLTFLTGNNTLNGDNRVALNAASDFTGNVTITTTGVATTNNMTVLLGATNAIPMTSVVTIDGQNGNGSSYADLNLNGFNQTLAGLTNTVRTSRLQRVYNSSGSEATLTINNALDSDFVFGGKLGKSSGDNFGLTKNGAGIFTLTGNNTFYGPTKISAGILSLGNDLALQGSPIDTQNSIVGDNDNGLETTVATLTFGGLTGNKNLAAVFNTLTGGYSNVTSLTLKPIAGASHTYSGLIADGAAGMTLTKTGAGTQTLSGANTYTGATTVAAGTLALVGSSQVSPITVNTGASLGFTLGSSSTSTEDVTFDEGSTVEITGDPVSSTTYTLLTTTATITGTPVLTQNIPGFVLQVDGGNTLKLVPVAPGSFAAWQSANDTTEAANLDHDNDGVSNGIEYFLGGSTDTTGFTALPGVVSTAGTLSVTWTKDATYTGTYGVGFVVETSATLDGPWVTEIADPNAGFTVTFPSANEVKYTFPSPLGTKNFARLKVTP